MLMLTFVCRVGAPACGDVMKLQILVDDENGIITDVKFKTFGCGSAIASSSYMTERVKGLTLDEASKIKNTEIAKELSLPPVKRIHPPFRNTIATSRLDVSEPFVGDTDLRSALLDVGG